ncbi:MAG: dihydropteroate synthase [Ruminococcus sp.]|nr:dihydropteroate synthase [Ruminococcus sp.]
MRGLSPLVAGSVPISVDTYHPETAERAVLLGATIVNCVYPEPVLDMLRICAKSGAELVIPSKSLGTVPESLGTVPIYLDPMIGFGTTREEDLEILQAIPELAKKGRVLIGASRKRIVKRLTGEKVPGKDLAGNLTIAVWAALKGADVVRVHDVRETVQALKVLSALQGGIPQ